MFMGKKLIPCVSVAAAVFAAAAAVSAEEPANEKKILNMNQFKEYTLAQGEIYKVFVKKDDGATTVTFPSAISKIAGVNVSTDGSTDFQISAQPGGYYFNLVALREGATGTLTVVFNRKTYILYLVQNNEKAFAAVNFTGGSGSGGASATAQYVLQQLGAREVVVISRHGEDNYENLDRHADAQIAVNTTPVGMYPNTGVSPVDLHRLPRLEAALDVVYNPARTEFLLQAEARGLRRANGLLMLAAQAKKSCEDFTGEPVDDAKIFSITKALEAQMHNVILIGMPGSGKTTIGTLVAKRLGRTFVDADSALEREAGMPIPEIFRLEGEAGFRRRETAVLAELGRQSGLVLATGGGSVTREENYPLLHQNGEIFCLQRALERLPSAGRPVSQALGAQTIYAQRKPLYARFADAMIDNNGTPEAAAAQILEVLGCSC